MKRLESGFTLIQLLVVIAIIAVVASLLVPSLAVSNRASNERNASTSMKTMSSAEADFRANDRDGNGVNDFWTADVKGLYTMTNAQTRAGSGLPIRLIEMSVAAADADGAHTVAGGWNRQLGEFARRDPKAGYWFVALTRDRSVGIGPEAPYRRDTGGTPPMGRCHHESKFGFAALPDSETSGKYIFWINENNSVFRSSVQCPLQSGNRIPATLGNDATPILDWPDDAYHKSYIAII